LKPSGALDLMLVSSTARAPRPGCSPPPREGGTGVLDQERLSAMPPASEA